MRRLRWRAGLAALVLLWLVSAVGGAQGAAGFADPAFERAWARADKPVAEGRAGRSWLWGDAPFAGGLEPYADAPGGQRLVQYFDKARMEINNPQADKNGPYYVTNGLLVVEMTSGRLQTGNNVFAPYAQAQIAVAGDPLGANLQAPTYEDFARVSTVNGNENTAVDRTAAAADMQIDGGGNVSVGDAGGVRYAHFVRETGHNIADVFWRFLNQQGPIYDPATGQYANGPLFDWVSAMGYPISEAYWTTVRIGGQDRRVLIQLFQRRVLTYNPANAAAWQIEMGNVGRHYAEWRGSIGFPLPQPPAAGTPGPAPIGTPIPAPGGSVRAWMSKADAAMNALTAMKGRSVTTGMQNGQPIEDRADYAYEAPDKFSIHVVSPRPGVSPDPTADQIRIGNRTYGRSNNAAQWDAATTTDTYQWPAYNYTYLGDHADEAILEKQETINGTPTQVVRTLIKTAKGEPDRYIRTYIATTTGLIMREVTEALANSEHGAGLSTTDFYDFNVPNNISAPTNIKP